MTRRIRKALPGVLLIPDLAATTASLQSWRMQGNEAPPPSGAAR